ncbi:MAG: PQQ-dependent sugar dehydrogenase [Planctomycetota bacterium]|nr:PQQ-dependent sugar dehydrogenase [Planctomycetota bacterium]
MTAALVRNLLIISLLFMAGATPVPGTSQDKPKRLPDVRLEPVFGSQAFFSPVQILPMPGEDDTFVIVEQRGRLIAKKTDPASKKKLLLDIRDRVRKKHSEEGLLSVVYAPDQEKDPRAYLYYSASKPRRTVLSRMNVREDGILDRKSEEVLLEIPQPYGNHNGGTVLFGPDGMLYLSIGDGGSANDPEHHAQNLGNLLGTVVRLDVSSDEKPYTNPKDNPFIGVEGARPEIWAYGLRNIWRMHFDSETGELWGGDVGQNTWEEVDIIRRGGNYGWRFREGKHDFRPVDDQPDDMIDPVLEYPRAAGQSITGGFVYRGDDIPDLQGAYLFSDYMTGKVWAARLHEGKEPEVREILKNRPIAISSFGEGPDGELYICGFQTPYAVDGIIYRIVGRNVK